MGARFLLDRRPSSARSWPPILKNGVKSLGSLVPSQTDAGPIFRNVPLSEVEVPRSALPIYWEGCTLTLAGQSRWGADDSGDAAVTVETILRQKGTDVATIEPDAGIRRAADWLREKNIGALVVTSGEAVLGLISEREIVHAFSRYGETAASMPVKEIMRY